ncbi:MAG: DUF1697 domain-containing protein [Gemmatimonadaceae bacterium]
MRYICFLRAINVGGRVVQMETLKEIFRSIGLADVETFIASGNVIFTSRSGKPAALEKKIEGALRSGLGYDVDAFLRTPGDLAEVVDAVPSAAHVAFTRDTLSPARREQLATFDTKQDSFTTVGREIYWTLVIKQSESVFASSKMEKLLSLRVTWRNMNTVRRLLAKYPPR